MKKILTAVLMGLLLVPSFIQAQDFTDTDQVWGVDTAGSTQFWQTWALHKVQINEEFTATTPSTGDILQWSGTTWIPATPTVLPADELVMNPLEWHFNSDQLGAAATVPDEAMTYRIPYGMTFDTAYLDCDDTHTSMVVTIASASTRYGTYSSEGTVSTSAASQDISSWGSLVTGNYMAARVSTASTGDATMCDLHLILTTD